MFPFKNMLFDTNFNRFKYGVSTEFIRKNSFIDFESFGKVIIIKQSMQNITTSIKQILMLVLFPTLYKKYAYIFDQLNKLDYDEVSWKNIGDSSGGGDTTKIRNKTFKSKELDKIGTTFINKLLNTKQILTFDYINELINIK
jgi:hypothetical protein